MKSILFAAVGLATAVVAQNIGDLAKCGQTCANNMLSAEKATELGCNTGDLACLCANKNFLFGLRDCSAVICPSEDAAKVVEYGVQVCKNAGVAITSPSGGSSATGGSATASATQTGSASSAEGSGTISTVFRIFSSGGSLITSAVATTTIGAGEGSKTNSGASGSGPSGSGASGSGVVSTFTSVITNSAGEVVTTIGETTLDGSGASKTAGAVVTTFTSGGSTIVSTLAQSGESTHTGSGASATASSTESGASGSASGTSSAESSGASGSSASGSGSSASASSTSGNAGMPQKTAAPMGVIAAAGLAVLIL